MKLPSLSDVLERMRQDIERGKTQLSNAVKPHRFPCPYCSKEVVVIYAPDGINYTLRHKVPGCPAYEKPDKDTRGDLIQAFVFHCRPTLRYGALEGLETKENK